MEEQKRKKLTRLADKMLEAQDKADALSNINTGSGFSDSVNGILDSFASPDLSTNEYIDKTKKAISLVKKNIILAEGHNNFDIDEYKNDRKELSDILFLMQSFLGNKSHEVFSKSSLQKINAIYKKHNGVNKLLT
tara:strand:- start:53736 stop:54140 length:405 start_codon:yes stop_codon:yes gene_type:complete